MFDEGFDYVALGHLHVPQRVGGRDSIRYSGSPIAMGFGEARQQKQVLLIQFGAIDNEVLELETTSDNAVPQLSSTITKVERSVEKNAKKATVQSGFIDDLFGFDEPAANHEMATTAIQENTNDQQEHDHKSKPNDDSDQMQVTSLPVPTFQKLAQISGDLITIARTIKALTLTESIWLEIVYTGDEIVSDLREQVQGMVEGLPCEVLKIKNTRTYNKILNQQQTSETLQDLNEMEVFERCLTINEVPDIQKDSLRDAYNRIVHGIHSIDSRAE